MLVRVGKQGRLAYGVTFMSAAAAAFSARWRSAAGSLIVIAAATSPIPSHA